MFLAPESLWTEPRNPEFKKPYPSRGLKKNGEPDMRLKENRRALGKRNIDGTPDMRFKSNKEKFGKNR